MVVKNVSNGRLTKWPISDDDDKTFQVKHLNKLEITRLPNCHKKNHFRMIKIRKPTKREIYDFLERPWKRRHRGHTAAKIYLVLSWVINSAQLPKSASKYQEIRIALLFSFILVASSFIVTLFIDRQTSCLFHSRDCFYIIVCIHVFFLKVIKNFKSQSSDDSNDVQIETSDSSVPKSLTNYITLSFVLVRKTERTQNGRYEPTSASVHVIRCVSMTCCLK